MHVYTCVQYKYCICTLFILYNINTAYAVFPNFHCVEIMMFRILNEVMVILGWLYLWHPILNCTDDGMAISCQLPVVKHRAITGYLCSLLLYNGWYFRFSVAVSGREASDFSAVMKSDNDIITPRLFVWSFFNEWLYSVSRFCASNLRSIADGAAVATHSCAIICASLFENY